MTSAEELAQYLGARRGELDGTKIVPALCEREEAGSEVLGRAGWLFELKLDGVRIIADKRQGRVRLSYRKMRDATASYKEIAEAVATLEEERVVLDGEIVAFDEQGRPDFQRLGHRISSSTKRIRSPVFVPVVYVVFDVLAIGPYDLRGFPIEARKEILSRILPAEGAAGGLIRRHPTFDNGVDLFRLCREHRLEGVVAKRLGSSYKAGERTTDWLKIKCELDAEFVVIGWTEGESDRAKLGALDLGAYEGDRLVFRGRVGSGLDGKMIDLLLEQLLPLEVPAPVAEGKYSPKPKRHHCRPEIVVSVRYGGFSLDPSGARFLRFPVFRGIRPDVSPKDCTVAPDDGPALALESPSSEASSEESSPGALPSPSLGHSSSAKDAEDESPASSPRSLRAVRTRRIHVTAPAQVILADGTTKDALCTYFEAVAPALLRHARGRVCALLRADGTMLWPPPKWTPKFARTATLRAGKREVSGFVVDSVDTLLFAVEAGCVSIEHWPFTEGQADVRDFFTLRVSAPTGSGAKELVAAARAVGDLAASIGLPAAAKSVAGRALDVVVGVGSASVEAASLLSAVLVQLAGAGGASGTRVEAIERVPTPFSPCVGGAAVERHPAADGSRAASPVAVPLGWDELQRVDLMRIGLADARARAVDAVLGDALDPIRGAVDLAAATEALERLIQRGS